MNTNRRDFFRIAGMAGTCLVSGGLSSCITGNESSGTIQMAHVQETVKQKHQQLFNMSGYAAPPLDIVRVGFIGLGMRGPGAVKRIMNLEGVAITALCDKFPERVHETQEILTQAGLPEAKDYSGSEDAWKELCLSNAVDLVYICTPWNLHTPMALLAMENDKHAAVEVPVCTTLDEAWQLVETSERTRKHCMMLENCCYDFFELLTLNMARQGFFGEIVHAEGAYIHDLRRLNFNKEGYTDMWRLEENHNRNGNLYPTHGLGPVCQVMNINRGDRMDYLTSMSTNDFQMAEMAEKLAKEDSFYQPYASGGYRGNMNTTLVRTEKGRTIMIQHDVTSPRPYSRIHLISGTKGVARKWPQPAKIAQGHSWFDDEEMRILEEQYTPPIVIKIGEMARKIGGHGGMDFMMDWRLIDCLRNGLPLDQDVYDAALWSSIAPLSEWSVANRSDSIDIPDFTCGAYKENKSVDLSLSGGATTGVSALSARVAG
jgi:hypothetical protein